MITTRGHLQTHMWQKYFVHCVLSHAEKKLLFIRVLIDYQSHSSWGETYWSACWNKKYGQTNKSVIQTGQDLIQVENMPNILGLILDGCRVRSLVVRYLPSSDFTPSSGGFLRTSLNITLFCQIWNWKASCGLSGHLLCLNIGGRQKYTCRW